MRVDESWAKWLDRLSPATREACVELPFRLGLTAVRRGSWTEYVQLEPFRELPRFVENAAALPIERIGRFCVAHHHAGFFGVVMDRVLDRQSQGCEDASVLLPLLAGAWRDTLAAAIEDQALAEHIVRSSTEACLIGAARETAALAARRITFDDYHAIIRLKTRWIAATTAAMLLVAGAPALDAFRRSFDFLIIGAQYLDDAKDASEDSLLRGISFPSALGVPAAVLERAAPRVFAHAAETAASGGLAPFADWLHAHAARADQSRRSVDSLPYELAAMSIAEMEV